MKYERWLIDRRAIITGDNAISRETAQVFEAHGASAIVTDDVAKGIGQLGGVDILVNAGGIYTPGYLDDFTEGDFAAAVDASIGKVIADTRTALPYMKDARRGDIINITGDLTTTSAPGALLISTCAAAIYAFSRSVTMDYVRYRVRANCVMYPYGNFGSIPVLGAPEAIDAAHAALWFASRVSRFIIAEALPVNGGTNYFSKDVAHAIR